MHPLALVSRRATVRLGAADLAGLAVGGPERNATEPATRSVGGDGRAALVLVPGQWAGPFVWHGVAPLLRAAGHDAYPVTCTGLGSAPVSPARTSASTPSSPTW